MVVENGGENKQLRYFEITGRAHQFQRVKNDVQVRGEQRVLERVLQEALSEYDLIATSGIFLKRNIATSQQRSHLQNGWVCCC